MIDIDFKRLLSQAKDFFADEKNRTYSVLGGTLVFALLFLIFLTVPGFLSFSKVSSETRELKDKITLVENHFKQLDQRNQALLTLKEELASYSQGLPKEKEITEFLEALSLMARVSNVKIVSITPIEPKGGSSAAEKGFYYALPINVTAQSGYHELGKFISNLESGKRFITVDKLRIQSNPSLPKTHNVNMVMKTYVSAEDEKK